MKLGDIIALARAGFTPGDIREFLAADVPAKIEPDSMDPVEAPAEKTVDEIPDNEHKDPEPEPKPEPADGAESLDYKKMYEESQEALKRAQSANIHKEMPADKSAQEIVDDLFRECI